MAPPTIGKAILVRLPEPLLSDIDKRAATAGLSRSETIRRMLTYSLKAEGGR